MDKIQIQIVVMRHGEKDGDRLAPKGAAQIFASTQALANKGLKFDRIFYSGAYRTHQSALIMAAALGKFDAKPQEYRGFHFDFIFDKTFNGNYKNFSMEVAEISKAGRTVSQALKISKYARMGRNYLIESLLELAEKMQARGETAALAASHSNWAELAAVNTDEMPYGLNEADAVCYTVLDDKIISSELIKAPNTNI